MSAFFYFAAGIAFAFSTACLVGLVVLIAAGDEDLQPLEDAPEAFGTCLDCAEKNGVFSEVARRLNGGRCETCGSASIVGVHTVRGTDWRFIRPERAA